ncbi:MAG: hypothetical protein ACK5LN_01360 [Propioniciclava sp.]
MDVFLDLARLSDARDTLAEAERSFNNAAAINDSLEIAIGNPHGKNHLRDRVGWFEAHWSSNREDLSERIKNVRVGLTEIIDTWDTWEQQATAECEQLAGCDSV